MANYADIYEAGTGTGTGAAGTEAQNGNVNPAFELNEADIPLTTTNNNANNNIIDNKNENGNGQANGVGTGTRTGTGTGTGNSPGKDIDENVLSMKHTTLDNLYFEDGPDSDEINDTKCGFLNYRPQFAQRFANKTYFMIIFSLLAVIQGMGWSYMTGTITTIQKRFKISSQTTGIVIAGNEVSQIIFSIVLGYYGGKGHRPRWIAIGVLFSAAACFLLASPHLFYGAGEDALSLTEEYANILDLPNSKSSLLNTTLSVTSSKRSKVQLCTATASRQKDDCDSGDTSILPLVFIFISQFLGGIGVLLFFSLGGPYLDDNINKSNSPMMFGITMSLRLVGPTLGFLFASACLKVFIAPTLTPYIKTDDPRWLGAWWLGWIVLGFLMTITAFLISLFPKKLPKAVEREKNAEIKKQELSDLKRKALESNGGTFNTSSGEENEKERMPAENVKEIVRDVKSLIYNKINLFNNISALFYMFAMIGYWTYMPKYLETIFMQTAVQASIISGLVGIASQSIGLLGSGWLISKFQPRARMLAGWNIFIGFLYVAVKISFTQMGCNNEKFNFLETSSGDGNVPLNLTSSCNVNCNCGNNNKFSPVCDKSTNQIYYSACHAGCTTFVNGTIGNCSCLSSPLATVTQGVCSEGCFTTFITFLGINAFIKLIDGSGRIGNLLVSYRCVHPSQKALSISLTIALLSAFALLPGPILFGYIFDSVCLIWGTKCGGRGNCWLYDGERLRYVFNLTAAGFTFMGAFFDCFVWYYAKELDLYDEQKNIDMWNREKEESKKNKDKNKK